MYIPAAFSETNNKAIVNLINKFSFATLVTIRDGIPFGSHIPFLLENKNGKPYRLLGHLAHANDHWHDFKNETEALAIFQGPHSYISPNWYKSKNMVPTWNYSAVHAYGIPRIIEEPEEVVSLLSKLTEIHEAHLTEGWSIDVVDQHILEVMLKQIVAFDMQISRIEAKWKVGQNRKPKDVLGAIEKLQSSRDPMKTELADEMRARLKK